LGDLRHWRQRWYSRAAWKDQRSGCAERHAAGCWTAEDVGKKPAAPGGSDLQGSGPDAVWTLTGTGQDVG